MATLNKKLGHQPSQSASNMRKLLIGSTDKIISDCVKIAKYGDTGDVDNVDNADRWRMMDYLMPMIQGAKETVKLDDLASISPIERSNRILESICKGELTIEAAENLINVLNKLYPPEVGQDDNNALIINVMSQTDISPRSEALDAVAQQATIVNQ